MHDGSYQINSIALPDGWSGSVLTACTPEIYRGGAGASCVDLPGTAQWQPVLAQLVSNRESLPNYTVLKYSRTGEVFRAHLAVGDRPLDVIGKQSRVYRRGWRMVLPFAQTRAARNFDRALTLLRAGINTALPLAVLERRSPKREAWLITEFVPGLVDLDQVALGLLPQSEAARLRKIKSALIDSVVDLLEALEGAGLAHHDFKASNIVLHDWDSRPGPPSVWLVDLDGLQHAARWNPAKHWQPVVRLAASLLGYTSVTRTDYGRFLKAYLKRRGTSHSAWRSHFHRLARQARCYLRRSQRRKSDKLDGYGGDA